MRLYIGYSHCSTMKNKESKVLNLSTTKLQLLLKHMNSNNNVIQPANIIVKY